MISFRDFIVFLAGFEFFHTINHIFLYYFAPLPLNLKFIILTPTLNKWAILINAILTIFLIWLASKLSH